MRRKDSKAKQSNKHNRKSYRKNCLEGNYIYVTDHAISRYQERIKRLNRENTQYSIVESVKRSRLIALTKHGGREIRENRGALFVCELQGNCLNVITVLVSDVDLRFVS